MNDSNNSNNFVEKESRLQELRGEIGDCTRCKLHKTRTTIVFGEGNPDARIMFIGEGPGKEEDLQGRPFVGRAGLLLTAIIEKGMNLKRSDVYIANVVKCRPTVNMEFNRDRPPDEEETSSCSGFLMKQIEIIQPEVIVTLGNPSTKFLLKTKQGITKIRGNWFDYHGIHVIPTYHPSYVLRNGGDRSPLKKDVWEDIKKVIVRLSLRDDITMSDRESHKARVELESLRDQSEDKKDEQGTLF